MTEPLRVANCSGFYGDRLDAAAPRWSRADPIDVLTGDWLAELTMLILWKGMQRDATRGWAHTFLTQMEEVLGTCVDRRHQGGDQRRRPQPGRPGRPGPPPGRPARPVGGRGPRGGRRPAAPDR